MKIKRIISVILIATMMLSIFVMPATATETTNEVIVHYYNENNWENPYIYYYYDGQTNPQWPGVPMTSESNGWYSYTISNYSTIKVIFSNNGADQYPAQNQEGLLVSGEKWFKSGIFYNQNPDSSKISVHYYNSNGWSNPYIYYYTDNQTPITWPGVAMTSDGNGWYSYDIYGFDETKVIFSNNGLEQNPAQNQTGYTVSGEKWFINNTWYDTEPNGITVHYYDYNNWGNVNIYYYNGNLEGNDWTGVPMNADGDGWYTYKIYGFDEARVLFNNGAGTQIPGVMEEGFLVSDEMWYRNGTWTTERPDEITIYFYKPENWSSPNIYYYQNDSDTGPAWPGSTMTSVGDNWYTYTITKYSTAKALFNDGNNQIPAQNQPGFDVTGIMWYKDGIMCNGESDTDEDELPDYMELLLGTDINIVDTDNDGLWDGYEFYTSLTDPTKIDTDGNGVSDNNEDTDSDGICNYVEKDYNTDPDNSDTDADGLSDYDEVLVYNTNPLKYDTDVDGMGDLTEVLAGLNPLSADSDSDGVTDEKETITQDVVIDKSGAFNIDEAKVIPSVTITGTGDYSTKLSAFSVNYNTGLSDIGCVVGYPYEFRHNEDLSFESCVLTFQVSDEVLEENNITDLSVAWFDESTNTLVPLDSQYDKDKKTVYAQVEHFSTYMLINHKNYFYDLMHGSNINTDISDESDSNSNNSGELETYNGHYYRVINESMPWTEAMSYCASLGGHLVTIQDEEEQEFITDLIKNNPEKNTYWIGLTGEDNQYSWITGEPLEYNNWADQEPNNSEENVVHMYANVENFHSLRAGQWNDTYNDYSANDYYSYLNCGIICEWDEKPVVSEKCTITLSSGEVITLDSDPTLDTVTADGVDPYSVDSDGDNIPDKTELIASSTKTIELYGREIECEVWEYRSNPAKTDTDGDGLDDDDDANPTRFDVTISSGFDGGALILNTGKSFNPLYTDVNEFLKRYRMLQLEIFSAYELRQQHERLVVNDMFRYNVDEFVALSTVDIEGVKYRMRNESLAVKTEVFNKLTGIGYDIFAKEEIVDPVTKLNVNPETFWSIDTPWESLQKYFSTAIIQVALGRYAEDDVTSLGTVAEIGFAFLGFDIIQDLRDVTYDLSHWEWKTNESIINLVVDAVGLVPVVGIMKKSDDIIAVIKCSDQVYEARKIASNVKFTVKNGIKYLGKTSDTISTAVKHNVQLLGNKIYAKTLDALNSSTIYKLRYGTAYDSKVITVLTEHTDSLDELSEASITYYRHTVADCGDTVYLDNVDLISKKADEIIQETLPKARRVANAMEGITTQIEESIRLGRHTQSIAQIATEDMDIIDDIARDTAQQLRNMINSGTITKTTGGKIREAVVTVAVDKQTGKIYYGISGSRSLNTDPLSNPTRRLERNEQLDVYFEDVGTSNYEYNLDNCGEFNAINNALFGEAIKENLCVYSTYISSGRFATPCDNCTALYSDFVRFIER
ncbi:MAG: starch-binding protein [Acutalibacteraceae bacterium]|nr:starch-binding protein [Acutalibacteraceae bacterium]